MWGFGIRQEDIVFIGSFFSLYWGSWGALVGAERLGATAFPFGAGVPGQSDRALEWMKEVRPTVFYGTPSYALYLAEKAKAKGLDPATDFNFRILFFSGGTGSSLNSGKLFGRNTQITAKGRAFLLILSNIIFGGYRKRFKIA
jgi:phenylacetate-CoA ligase